ncbi:MAG: diacylglycerol/lipid kinase family protein [Burkholderiaceae bacterium]
MSTVKDGGEAVRGRDDGGHGPGAEDRKRALEAAIGAERRAVLVVNTRSRRSHRLYRDARRLLLERGMVLDADHAVREPARVLEIVRDAVAHGHRLIIVAGGDGTISSVVGMFAYRDSVLAILPLGTANSFARAVGIPLALEGAVDVATSGKVADVDLGCINDNYFANAAAIGLPASIARHMPAGIKRWFGRVGYLFVAIARLGRHRPFHCSIARDGETVSFDALEVRIANGEYQGGVRVADEASVESHDLVIQSIRGSSATAIARFWLRAVLGLKNETADVEVIRARDFTLKTSPPQDVSIDGEPVTRTPIHARVARQALLLRVARDHTEIH